MDDVAKLRSRALMRESGKPAKERIAPRPLSSRSARSRMSTSRERKIRLKKCPFTLITQKTTHPLEPILLKILRVWGVGSNAHGAGAWQTPPGVVRL